MNELTDEQINRAIHEKVMGLCWHDNFEPRDGDAYCLDCNSIVDFSMPALLQFHPRYTTDLNAVALAEAKASEKVGYLQMYKALRATLGLNGYTSFATARQRSLAVLKAMEIEI